MMILLHVTEYIRKNILRKTISCKLKIRAFKNKTTILRYLNLNHIFDNLNDINDKDTNKPDTPLSRHNLITANTQTLHTLKHTNSNLLLFLEALYIKYRNPVLNNGLRASKELPQNCCLVFKSSES